MQIAQKLFVFPQRLLYCISNSGDGAVLAAAALLSLLPAVSGGDQLSEGFFFLFFSPLR